MAAQTSWQFIQEVGLNTDPNTGQKEAVNVSFQFMQNGHIVQLNVPLLTIVPIPYIAIHDIDINFKANISASSSSVSEQSSSSALDVGAEASIGAKWGPFHMDAKMKANYSSKKDSKATQESTLTDGKATLIATYKNSKGIFEPESIKIDGVTGKVSDDSVVFELKEAKTYTVVAGKKKVSVDVQNIKPDTKTDTTKP